MTQVFIDNDVKNHPWASIKIHAIVYVVSTDTVRGADTSLCCMNTPPPTEKLRFRYLFCFLLIL